MLSPDYLKDVSDDAVKLYSKLENSILKDVVRRLKNTDFEMTESARYQIQVAQEAGLLYDDIIDKISKYSGESKKVVKKTFEKSAIQALKFDDKIYKKQGLNPIPIKQSKTMLNLLKTTLNKTNGSLYNLTLTTADTTQTRFIEALDDAYLQISSGAFDYNTAIKNATKKFANGIQVEYNSGYRLNIKSAVQRAIMTGVNQTCLKMQELRAEEMGCDLVEVTAHGGARPDHAEWQGKIYSRSGKSKKYPDLVKATGYGTGPGLGGWNCRHSMMPYYEGTTRAYTDEELEELKSKEENDIIEEKELSLEECKNVIEKHNIKFIEEDLKVLDLKLLSDNTKQFDKLLNKYPIMKEYIANKNMHFGAESFANKSTVAAFRNGLDYKNLSIHLSKNKYSSYDSFIKMEQNEVYIFHSMPCADNMLSVYSITHEFGHFI